MPVQMDIEVPRNGDYTREGRLVDDAGLPIDLTGCTMRLEIRRLAGDGGAPVATADIDIEPGIAGRFTETIRGADLGGLTGTFEVVRFAYDLVRIDPDGLRFVERRGFINYVPGVTYG